MTKLAKILISFPLAFLITPAPTVSADGKFPPITIMVIDTGVNYDVPEIAKHVPNEYKTAQYKDNHGHGTNVSGIILDGVCDQVRLIPCRYIDPLHYDPSPVVKEDECLQKALNMNVDVINFSSGGNLPDKREFALLKKILAKNVIVVIAAGNGGKELSFSNNVDLIKKKILTRKTNGKNYYFPASYNLKKLVRVSSYHNDSRVDSSNYADGFAREDGIEENGVESWDAFGNRSKMIGTSQAAAKFSNRVLKKFCNLYK